MIALYDFTLSGNCYKVRLMLALLGLEYKAIPVNLKEGEHKEAKFLKRIRSARFRFWWMTTL